MTPIPPIPELTVIYSDGEDGFVIAECPELPGCVSQGETHEKAKENIADAIQAVLLVRIAKLTAEVERLQNTVFDKQKLYTQALLAVDELGAEITRLKAPVTDEEWAKNDNGRCLVQDAWTHKRTMMTRMEIDDLIHSRAAIKEGR